ncbi:hypothetical protein M1446_02905 [Candidatus Dependentiae bacterium]|nr:hypothetical protein [Candidatus Dependentiae bacterium]
MNFKIKILSILVLLSLNCFAMETEDNSDPVSKFEPASQLYQILGTEAQMTLGIPKEKHLPIKQFHYMPGALAMALPNAIIVNENVQNISYGIKRCTMLHEVVHVKHHDAQFFLDLKEKDNVIELEEEEHRIRENRADIQGCYAAQCFMCVHEFSKARPENYDQQGYLTSGQVLKIAEELKQQNKICAYHSN